MKYIFIILVIISIGGCNTIQNKYQSDSINDLNAAFKSKSLAQPTEAILSLSQNGSLIIEGQTYFINPSTAQMVNFGSFTSPALLKKLAKPAKTLLVKSYVVKPDTGHKYLFYPVVTTFDEELNKLSEVMPVYEFAFENNILTNTFTLPPPSKYILIHSKPKFIGMEFSESATGSYSDKNAVIAGVLGGAIGGGIYGALTSGNTGDRPFYFALGGAVSIESN